MAQEIVPPQPKLREMELLPRKRKESLAFCWHNSREIVMNSDGSITLTFEKPDFLELQKFFRLRFLE
jgi:hypothetical protein